MGGGGGGHRGWAPPPPPPPPPAPPPPHPLTPLPRYILQSLVFYNHFEEIQSMLFEVELIIHNAPSTYVYPNTIETCLTPNYLLFGTQLL